MATRTKATSASDPTAELIRDLIIVQLGLAGVGQRQIRAIVKADMNRINRIVKNVRKAATKSKE